MSTDHLIGRVVSSAQEANALPDDTVLIDKWERVYQLDEVWIRHGEANRLAHEPGTEMSGYASMIDYPATVIWVPGETP